MSEPYWEVTTCTKCGWFFCLSPAACEKTPVASDVTIDGEETE